MGCSTVSASDAARSAQVAGEFGTLFQQNGVAFRARIDNDAAPRSARLAIANQSAAPVEVSFVVGMEVRADSTDTVTERSLGQRCVRLEANQVVAGPVAALDFSVPTGAIAGLRIRYVSITNLSAVAASPAPRATNELDAAQSDPCLAQGIDCEPVAEGEVGPLIERLPEVLAEPVGGGEVSPSAPPAGSAGNATAERGAAAPGEAPWTRVGRWIPLPTSPAELLHLTIRALSAAALAVAGLMLAVPIGGALYLLLLLTPLSLLRRALRGAPPA